ncbi:putative amino acid permease [Trypanosoma rangeli]|uniref:Putative amino acid permease n=1 Tax=Trypanosoma rangeli TaxID=5698 RepID=A0A3S5IRV3_TRYRA|nr:putative amino acid permease [Trypanosoma rangeli]RNF09034.1 putative amino acid permease [Trypanosoma rangeli]|eukprot:RNF09034.1 putative amino acid permease [Trypanosoma rangeli]
MAFFTTSRSSSPTVRFRNPRRDSESRPKTALTTLTLLGVIYTASISGGYGLEESVSAGGPLLTIVFLCIIPFLWGIPVSLCVAELSCAIPSNAGPIMWVNVFFPPWFTFCMVIWTAFLNFVDNSLYPTVLADYCATLLKLNFVEKSLVKVFFMGLCVFINLVGIQTVGNLSVAVMAVTLLPFLLMFIFQLPFGFNWERIGYVPENINWSVFLPVVAWNFSGFDSAGNVIEEVSNPNPTFIRALGLMIISALATYIPPILVGSSAEALKNTPFEDWDNGFWVRVGEAVGGYAIAVVVTIGGVISTVGLMTTLLATTSRSLAGMGTLNAFPYVSEWLSRYHNRYGTPFNAIVVNSIITCALSLCFSFHTLVEIDQILYSLCLIATLLVFLGLRFKQPFLERPYRAPGGLVAALFCGGVPIAFSLVLIAVSMFGSPMLFWSTLAMICGTVIVSYFWVSFFRPEGFEGKLVEDYEDADMQTYGSLLEKGCNEWRRMHPHHTFIDRESPEDDE